MGEPHQCNIGDYHSGALGLEGPGTRVRKGLRDLQGTTLGKEERAMQVKRESEAGVKSEPQPIRASSGEETLERVLAPMRRATSRMEDEEPEGSGSTEENLSPGESPRTSYSSENRLRTPMNATKLVEPITTDNYPVALMHLPMWVQDLFPPVCWAVAKRNLTTMSAGKLQVSIALNQYAVPAFYDQDRPWLPAVVCEPLVNQIVELQEQAADRDSHQIPDWLGGDPQVALWMYLTGSLRQVSESHLSVMPAGRELWFQEKIKVLRQIFEERAGPVHATTAWSGGGGARASPMQGEQPAREASHQDEPPRPPNASGAGPSGVGSGGLGHPERKDQNQPGREPTTPGGVSGGYGDPDGNDDGDEDDDDDDDDDDFVPRGFAYTPSSSKHFPIVPIQPPRGPPFRMTKTPPSAKRSGFQAARDQDDQEFNEASALLEPDNEDQVSILGSLANVYFKMPRGGPSESKVVTDATKRIAEAGRFDGHEDSDLRITVSSLNFILQSIPQLRRMDAIQLISHFLKGDAWDTYWMDHVIEGSNQYLKTWAVMLRQYCSRARTGLLQRRFRQATMESLGCKTFPEFARKLRKIAPHGAPGYDLIDRFLNGIPKNVAREVQRPDNPASLAEAVMIAEKHRDLLGQAEESVGRTHGPYERSQARVGSTPHVNQVGPAPEDGARLPKEEDEQAGDPDDGARPCEVYFNAEGQKIRQCWNCEATDHIARSCPHPPRMGPNPRLCGTGPSH